MLCAFFAAPYLPGLLIIAPLAAAGPLTAQFSRPDSHQAGELTWGATALAMTLALILNRMFRRQHDLAVAHEHLVEERLRVLDEAERTGKADALKLTLGEPGPQAPASLLPADRMTLIADAAALGESGD